MTTVNMKQLGLHSIEIDTKELVLDMTYDWHGKRLAIVTADRKVSIYVKQDDGKWIKQSEFTAHYGPIWKIKWAHEYFGNIITTCRLLLTRLVRQESHGVRRKHGYCY